MQRPFSDVFSRTESSGLILGVGIYNLVIGLTLCWGFLANFLMVKNLPMEGLLQTTHPLLIILAWLGCALGGVALFNKSNNPLISFLGYNLVILPFGLMVDLVTSRYLNTSQYNDGLVLEAIQTTGLATFAMMVLGSIFPRFFSRIFGALTIGLLVVVVVEIIGIVFWGWAPGAIDWLVAISFCGYIGYTWGRANRIPKTLDNAIDSAAALYMDIINLFIRILRILGRRS